MQSFYFVRRPYAAFNPSICRANDDKQPERVDLDYCRRCSFSQNVRRLGGGTRTRSASPRENRERAREPITSCPIAPLQMQSISSNFHAMLSNTPVQVALASRCYTFRRLLCTQSGQTEWPREGALIVSPLALHGPSFVPSDCFQPERYVGGRSWSHLQMAASCTRRERWRFVFLARRRRRPRESQCGRG